jgi:hypothetical protein
MGLGQHQPEGKFITCIEWGGKRRRDFERWLKQQGVKVEGNGNKGKARLIAEAVVVVEAG